ncbi:L,D-transpeptidase [Terrarubrum flagellatum]|uniref:L,D-transpeptidase n=1 Tax=Terrirubrum flagellatum TaxID=2895980 RepID=UPI0031456480
MIRSIAISIATAAALFAVASPASAYEIDILTGKPLLVPDANPTRAEVTAIPREEVAYSGREAAGTIIVNSEERRLYFVLPGGRAVKYAVGVGRPGFGWGGVKHVERKAEWPAWTPPAQMLKRRPDLPTHMEGGIDNPLGARAMYLSGSLFRIHGSNEPETIGQAVSSGCIRMTNEDVIDLYQRVRVGTKVVVLR